VGAAKSATVVVEVVGGVVVATTVVAASSAGDPSASLALQLTETRSAAPRIHAARLLTSSTIPTSTQRRREVRAHLVRLPHAFSSSLRDDQSMVGAICLQGGNEFAADCREMDTRVLQLAGPGCVAVIAGAARPGSDYSGASERARRHYAALGSDVVVVPDPRESVSAAVDAMADAVSVIILPGGSPTSLRAVLFGPVLTRLLEMHATGAAISGASAGAMVLCSRMVCPGRPGPEVQSVDIVDGLGLVRGLALPHWTPGSDRGWPVPDDLDLWGLPECGGVVLIDGTAYAVGRGEPALRRDGKWQPIPREPTGVRPGQDNTHHPNG